MKSLKEKEPVVNERIEQSPARIDKIEEIIINLGSAFSSFKNIDKTPPNKNCKFVYVHKTYGATSSKGNEDLKMISVHPNFINLIRDHILKPLSVSNNHCVIKELDVKDDNT